MNPKAIRDILEGYFSPLPDGIELKVSKYIELLGSWGLKVPLTSIRDPEKIVRFHFGESIFAISLSDLFDGRLADVGAGAGFPGLALKLARPKLSVTLIEPNAKKCAFLHEVARSLKLEDVEIISRQFKTSNIADDSVDYVSSRALRGQASLIDWAEEKLTSSGSVLLWVGGIECETLRANQRWLWTHKLIPGTTGRFILRGKKSI